MRCAVVVVVVVLTLNHRYNAVRGHRTGSNSLGFTWVTFSDSSRPAVIYRDSREDPPWEVSPFHRSIKIFVSSKNATMTPDLLRSTGDR